MRKATREFRVDGVGRLKLDVRTVRDVAGDLELGSAGREGAGQAHDQDLLAGAGLAHVQEDRRVELEAVLRVVAVSRRRVLAASLTLSVSFRPGVLTTVSRSSALRCATVGLRLVTQPSRAGAARVIRGCSCGRDTAACMDLHIRDRIPGFHHGCVRARTFRGWRLRFAALWPARVPHSTSNVSHLKERLC